MLTLLMITIFVLQIFYSYFSFLTGAVELSEYQIATELDFMAIPMKQSGFLI